MISKSIISKSIIIVSIVFILIPIFLFAYNQAENFRYPLDVAWIVTLDFWEYVQNRGWHLGEDSMADATTPVYAPSNGVVKHIQNRTGYGNV